MRIAIFILFFSFCQLLFLVPSSLLGETSIGLKDYLDTNFKNIGDQQIATQAQIKSLSEKIDKNNETLNKKNEKQDDYITENSNQISSLRTTIDILKSVLIGTGSAGTLTGGILAYRAKRKTNSKNNSH